jgi:hypothetical protein
MFLYTNTVQSGSAANTASYSMGVGVLFLGQSGEGVKLTIHLHLVPRVRIN